MLNTTMKWIEERTGLVSITQNFLTEDIPGGASYWYVFGSVTLFAMIVQIVTGILLTFFYAPSTATAWESTRAIYLNPWTHFLLSLHYWGASAMIALVVLHLLQVLIWGAYKAPRELNWVVGVLLLLVTLVLGLTGYLLPWDMNAYFASQVSLNIVGVAPGGSVIQNVAQGGSAMGTATINRFFGLHVWLMPAALLALVGVHLVIFRRQGPAGPVPSDRRLAPPGRFWPDQLFMDGAVSLIVFAIIVLLACFVPPYLDAKANPTVSNFTPYPAWYFLSLFGLLAVVPPNVHLGPLTISTELFATIIVPTVFGIIVLLLPWFDRSKARGFGSRRGVLWMTAIALIAILGLSIFGQVGIVRRQTAGPPSPPESLVLAAKPALVAPVTSSGAMIYAANCSRCHGAQGQGVAGAFPPLAENTVVTGDPKTVIGIVLGGLHGAIAVNGQTYNGTMPPWKGSLSDADAAAVVTYIRGSLSGNHASAVTAAQVATYNP
ncbi:MAG TPA: cytochrome b N-terminal domain-containing protein [Candidatus Tumulicola sp.]|jgi:ubiquinol-cytochrome c reductase cytochrome b subunit